MEANLQPSPAQSTPGQGRPEQVPAVPSELINFAGIAPLVWETFNRMREHTESRIGAVSSAETLGDYIAALPGSTSVLELFKLAEMLRATPDCSGRNLHRDFLPEGVIRNERSGWVESINLPLRETPWLKITLTERTPQSSGQAIVTIGAERSIVPETSAKRMLEEAVQHTGSDSTVAAASIKHGIERAIAQTRAALLEKIEGLEPYLRRPPHRFLEPEEMPRVWAEKFAGKIDSFIPFQQLPGDIQRAAEICHRYSIEFLREKSELLQLLHSMPTDPVIRGLLGVVAYLRAFPGSFEAGWNFMIEGKDTLGILFPARKHPTLLVNADRARVAQVEGRDPNGEPIIVFYEHPENMVDILVEAFREDRPNDEPDIEALRSVKRHILESTREIALSLDTMSRELGVRAERTEGSQPGTVVAPRAEPGRQGQRRVTRFKFTNPAANDIRESAGE